MWLWNGQYSWTLWNGQLGWDGMNNSTIWGWSRSAILARLSAIAWHQYFFFEKPFSSVLDNYCSFFCKIYTWVLCACSLLQPSFVKDLVLLYLLYRPDCLPWHVSHCSWQFGAVPSKMSSVIVSHQMNMLKQYALPCWFDLWYAFILSVFLPSIFLKLTTKFICSKNSSVQGFVKIN